MPRTFRAQTRASSGSAAIGLLLVGASVGVELAQEDLERLPIAVDDGPVLIDERRLESVEEHSELLAEHLRQLLVEPFATAEEVAIDRLVARVRLECGHF